MQENNAPRTYQAPSVVELGSLHGLTRNQNLTNADDLNQQDTANPINGAPTS